MQKKIIISGFAGGIVFLLWMFIVNAVLGFKNSMDMKHIPNEALVYEILKENIKQPGRYVCNPQITGGRFPENEPVYSILYGGVGHEAAGRLMLVQLLLFFLAPLVGAYMLSTTSDHIMNSYMRRVLFFTGIGLLIALFSDLMNFGIGNYPAKDALFRAIHDVILWTLIGLVVSWLMKPASESRVKEEVP